MTTAARRPRTPTDHSGTTLQQFASDSNGGVVYDDSASSLELEKEGGVFSSTFFPADGKPQYACSGDFDEDGWNDFIGATSNGEEVGFFKNQTYDNLAAYPADWTNPSYVLPPRFVRTGWFYTSSTSNDGGGVTACGDFNGDTHQDVAMVLERGNDGGQATLAKIWLGNGDGTFQTPYNLTSNYANDFYDMKWDGNMVAVDYNGDHRLDLLFGGYDSGGGSVRVFLNNGGSAPTFTRSSTYLLQNAGLGSYGVNAIAYDDFTGDGVKDLAVAGKGSSHIHLYPGLPAGGVSTADMQDITAASGAALLMDADFSLDGHPDLVMATDGNSGQVWYYKSNGTDTPFSGGRTQVLSESFSDFDTGFVFDYDNDPDHTLDMMLADGNGAGYSTFANRFNATYVDCGDVQSGVLDLGPLEGDEMVVTAARLSPDMNLPSGTTVTFYMSNEDPASWQEAAPCADDASDYCATFVKPVGRTVRWKATMCSNSIHTTTPTISGVTIDFDYTQAQEHYRAGVVVDDGVAYVGAFRQPGDRGHFYALNAGLDQTYWDAASKLDAMADSERNVYTSKASGKSRLDFTDANASSSALQSTLGVSTDTDAQAIIDWQRSARFGVDTPLSRLGSVELSTPAILSPPQQPSWYDHADATEKQLINTFDAAHADRPLLALFGSKDGALHAIRNDPSSITASTNGTEEWAFIPAKVAAGLNADMTSGTLSSYPDGSPTLADVKLDDGAMHTVLVMGGGNGYQGVFALDVTDTVSASDGTVSGPDPLWDIVPGGSKVGQVYAKPAIARVKVDGAERFIAILGSGISRSNPVEPFTEGRDVWAVDMSTGTALWRFRARCALTSDLVVFETADALEPGAPQLDGYIDRVVFADACGYVYKLDPAQDVYATDSNGWIDSSTLGTIDTGKNDGSGHDIMALFSTASSSGALGAERPIAGTIGVRADSTGREVLFFGTGGLESYDPTQANEFYAVYADSGQIRTKLSGTCTAAGCEKFYGGVVVSPEQVFLTRAVDSAGGHLDLRAGFGRGGGAGPGRSRHQLLGRDQFGHGVITLWPRRRDLPDDPGGSHRQGRDAVGRRRGWGVERRQHRRLGQRLGWGHRRDRGAPGDGLAAGPVTQD